MIKNIESNPVQSQTLQELKNAIRDVPDFPKPGIIFKDITTILNDRKLFRITIEALCELIDGHDISAVAAIESRGFIFGSVIAYQLNLKFVPIRKPGKLPFLSWSEEYLLEYGSDRVEMHQDALEENDCVLLVDDLLATGGTARASCKLIERSGAIVDSLLFFLELGFLKGRHLLSNYEIKSLIYYD